MAQILNITVLPLQKKFAVPLTYVFVKKKKNCNNLTAEEGGR